MHDPRGWRARRPFFFLSSAFVHSVVSSTLSLSTERDIDGYGRSDGHERFSCMYESSIIPAPVCIYNWKFCLHSFQVPFHETVRICYSLTVGSEKKKKKKKENGLFQKKIVLTGDIVSTLSLRRTLVTRVRQLKYLPTRMLLFADKSTCIHVPNGRFSTPQRWVQ